MDKATKVAVEKYPHGKFDGDIGDSLRAACVVGYMQAEKDLALTWEDVATLIRLCEQVKTEWWFRDMKGIGTQKHFEEVLRRFNSQREKK